MPVAAAAYTQCISPAGPSGITHRAVLVCTRILQELAVSPDFGSCLALKSQKLYASHMVLDYLAGGSRCGTRTAATSVNLTDMINLCRA